jgi:hypothetical protein
MFDWIGWLATVVFASSYFCKDPTRLRTVQAVAAVMWICYGVVIGAWPVIVANAVVATLAASSAWRGRAVQDGDGKQTPAAALIASGTGAMGSGFPLPLHPQAKSKPHFEVE